MFTKRIRLLIASKIQQWHTLAIVIRNYLKWQTFDSDRTLCIDSSNFSFRIALRMQILAAEEISQIPSIHMIFAPHFHIYLILCRLVAKIRKCT